MKKKSSKKAPPAYEAPIQFRPGCLLGEMIENVAKKWAVSKNEAARRLTAMAMYELDVRHYDLVVEVTTKMVGDPDFAEACQRIYLELHTTDRVREENELPALNEDERQERIRCFVQVVDCYYGLTTEEEKQKVHIQQYRN